MSQNSPLLSVEAAAETLAVSISWLNKLRVSGGGPPFSKLGRRVVYSYQDLQDWVASRRRNSTSDNQPPSP
jgi:predicted DNA-binding transcriptional regulator AlpA